MKGFPRGGVLSHKYGTRVDGSKASGVLFGIEDVWGYSMCVMYFCGWCAMYEGGYCMVFVYNM